VLQFYPYKYILRFYEGVGVRVLKSKESESEVLKIEELDSELLCTDSTALGEGINTEKMQCLDSRTVYIHCW
jgi:hypothetical protein